MTGPGQIEPQPAPPPQSGPTDLVIRTDAVGICATDLELLSGTMPYLTNGFARYPVIPGHEWTGTVIGIGQEVSDFAIGDRIVGECSIGCGTCARCLTGSYHLCPKRTETGIAGRPGALASALVFPAAAAHHVPATVSARDAALVEPLAVAYRGLSRAGVPPRGGVGIIGAGTIGLLCALAARALEVADIYLFEVDPHRRRFAASLGFAVSERPGHQLPAVIEASGTAAGAAAAVDACLDGGTIVLLGLTGSSAEPMNLDRIVTRDLTVIGSLSSPGIWPEVINLIAEGRVQPSKLVSHEFPLDDVAVAFSTAAGRAPGVRKILVWPNEEARNG